MPDEFCDECGKEPRPDAVAIASIAATLAAPVIAHCLANPGYCSRADLPEEIIHIPLVRARDLLRLAQESDNGILDDLKRVASAFEGVSGTTYCYHRNEETGFFEATAGRAFDPRAMGWQPTDYVTATGPGDPTPWVRKWIASPDGGAIGAPAGQAGEMWIGEEQEE